MTPGRKPPDIFRLFWAKLLVLWGRLSLTSFPSIPTRQQAQISWVGAEWTTLQYCLSHVYLEHIGYRVNWLYTKNSWKFVLLYQSYFCVLHSWTLLLFFPKRNHPPSSSSCIPLPSETCWRLWHSLYSSCLVLRCLVLTLRKSPRKRLECLMCGLPSKSSLMCVRETVPGWAWLANCGHFSCAHSLSLVLVRNDVDEW